MDCVFTFADIPVSAEHWVVVAIGEPDADQRHIGVLHRDQNAGLQVLHLAWHCRLRNDARWPGDMSVWVAPSAPPARQRSIAAFCRRVWRKNAGDGIPYAFSSPNTSFDPATGEFLIGPSRFGLTCASFVLALFHAAGLPLADYETWPVDRSEDQEWQQTIVGILEGQQVEQQHIEHLRSEIGAVRYRPEEVAAAVALAPPPASFQRAEELGRQILDLIRENSSSSDQSE